jgi:hypothetical protein
MNREANGGAIPPQLKVKGAQGLLKNMQNFRVYT